VAPYIQSFFNHVVIWTEDGLFFWAEKTHLNIPTIHYVSNCMIGLKMKPWNNICKAIAKCLISIIFLVHYCFKQLWDTHHNPKDIKENTKKSLRALRVDSVQLFLMHWPFGFKVKYLVHYQSGTLSYLYLLIGIVISYTTWLHE
jgi:hypothetical protein